MTWVKLDDGFAGHPKIEECGPLAAWIFVASLCYCAQYLTDGRIPKAKATKLTDVPKPAIHIRRLIDAGLWEDDGDCYVVHDYLKYQPSRANVEAERQAAAERKRRSREMSRRDSTRDTPTGHAESHGVTPPVRHGGSHGVGHGGSHTSPTPTRPDPSRSSESSSSSLSQPQHPEERDPRVDEALDWYAEDVLQDRIASGVSIPKQAAYRAAVRAERAERDGPDLDAIAAQYPHLNAAELRTELEDRRFLA